MSLEKSIECGGFSAVGWFPALNVTVPVELVQASDGRVRAARSHWRQVKPCTPPGTLLLFRGAAEAVASARLVGVCLLSYLLAVQLVCRPGGAVWLHEVAHSLPVGFLCFSLPVAQIIPFLSIYLDKNNERIDQCGLFSFSYPHFFEFCLLFGTSADSFHATESRTHAQTHTHTHTKPF